jgi:peptidoglycan/xylan/chitin deacetylase (PgdA/CDA1 family)
MCAVGRVRDQRSKTAWLVLSLVSLASLVALALIGTATAASGDAGAGGPAINSASLQQVGQDLHLTISLAAPLPSASLGSGESLCVLLERSGSGSVRAELCLAGRSGRHHGLRLLLAPVSASGAGPSRAIPGEVSRPSRTTIEASFLPAAAGIPYRPLRWQLRSATSSGPCTPAGSDCATLTPAQPELVRLHVPRPVGCVPTGSSLVFGGAPARREIALSFDDGPWNDPPSIDFVRLLARYGVPATFFEIGDEIAAEDPHGAAERAMLADGDMIGNHTWTHPDMAALSPAAQRAQLESTDAAIRRATGFTPCLWRPPYDDFSPGVVALARSLGMLTIDWNIDPRDWSLPGVGSIEATAIDNARPGGIVELHFGGGPRLQTLAALPDIITTLRRRGYRFVTVAQMLGLRVTYR